MKTPLQGEVFFLYAFDVADEIRTDKAEKILAKKKAVPSGPSNERLVPKVIPFYRPLTIDPHHDSWRIEDRPVQTLVRIYDVGVVSVLISVPFEAGDLKELLRFHRPILDNKIPLDKAAHELSRNVVDNLREYLVSASEVNITEAYTVFVLRQLGQDGSAERWAEDQRREIAGLLAETDPAMLSQQQIDETFRHKLSFESDDVVIVDWDAALVVDLAGDIEDEIHVLELANLQLEELVLMDKRLDVYLNRAYEELEQSRTKLFSLKRNEIKKLRRFRMDVAKITDEVSNISKFFGDWYLARIYLAARDRFHLATWRESIQNRILHLDNLYETLHGEANEARMLFLEAMIVLLFIIDLVAVFWLKR
ncbi:MAG TPA: hypothetical protein VJP40_08555 [bacterium]|nr:hypothetical protein [bacterium]